MRVQVRYFTDIQTYSYRHKTRQKCNIKLIANPYECVFVITCALTKAHKITHTHRWSLLNMQAVLPRLTSFNGLKYIYILFSHVTRIMIRQSGSCPLGFVDFLYISILSIFLQNIHIVKCCQTMPAGTRWIDWNKIALDAYQWDPLYVNRR